MLKTSFWKKAAGSLPVPVQARYLRHFEDAERFDLFLDAAADAWKSCGRFFQVSPSRAQ